MTDKTITVLVVDDSAVVRLHLVHLLKSDPRIGEVAAVAGGQAAIDRLMINRSDVVVMDMHMPGMDGFEATRRIMETAPVPIVICSATTDSQDMGLTFRTIDVGAVACVQKPVGAGHHDFPRLAAEFLQTVVAMSEVKVVRRWSRKPTPPAHASGPSVTLPRASGAVMCVGVGASTGGPPALQAILTALPKDFPIPILVVQHIARGFLDGMASWLRQTTPLNVQLAVHGTTPQPGHVYLAPDDKHMTFGRHGRIVLSAEPTGGLRPAVGQLFQSLAEAWGPRAIGVLLTGMGKDGAAELKLMKDAGAVTIAQDRESSVVHGMPGEAVALDGATYVLPPDGIAKTLVAEVTRRNTRLGA